MEYDGKIGQPHKIWDFSVMFSYDFFLFKNNKMKTHQPNKCPKHGVSPLLAEPVEYAGKTGKPHKIWAFSLMFSYDFFLFKNIEMKTF